MRVVYEYSHLGGSEILKVRYPKIDIEIYEVIAKVRAQKIKISKESTMPGANLFDPKNMNIQFKKIFYDLSYKELKEPFTIKLPNYDRKIKGNYKQVDFEKDKVLIEVQFGKYFAMFYDLAKFQYFFNENKAEVGVEIVACHKLYSEMSSGVSYGELLIFDIERLKRHFPAVPIKIFLIDADESDSPN